MNILIFSSKYPPEIGGVEEVVKNLSIEFSKTNNVQVITTFLFSKRHVSFVKKFFVGFKVVGDSDSKNSISIKTIFMSLPRSLFGYLSFFYRFPASVIAIRKSIRTFNPDIINAHFLDDSLYFFYFATVFLKKPIVLDIHGNEIHLFSKSPSYKFLFNKIIKKSKKIIVHTQFMKNELLKIYQINPAKVKVVPNGVDTKKFSVSKKYETPRFFLYVGRFDSKKGIEILLKAFTSVQDKISSKLIVVGDGKGESKHGKLSLTSLKQKYSSKKIKFTGLIDNAVVVEYYKRAYFTVFPSLYEPFGIVALESISCGTPFIASSGGFVEIATETRAGIIFKKEDIGQLSKILLKVDKNSKLRDTLSKNGLKNINKFSWESISNKYLNIFGL